MKFVILRAVIYSLLLWSCLFVNEAVLRDRTGDLLAIFMVAQVVVEMGFPRPNCPLHKFRMATGRRQLTATIVMRAAWYVLMIVGVAASGFLLLKLGAGR